MGAVIWIGIIFLIFGLFGSALRHRNEDWIYDNYPDQPDDYYCDCDQDTGND